MTTRRRFQAEFKAKAALAAVRGDKAIEEIASAYEVHPSQDGAWKRRALDGLGEVFSNGTDRVRMAHQKIYPHELRDGFEAKRIVGNRIGFYDTGRPHVVLGDLIPAEA